MLQLTFPPKLDPISQQQRPARASQSQLESHRASLRWALFKFDYNSVTRCSAPASVKITVVGVVIARVSLRRKARRKPVVGRRVIFCRRKAAGEPHPVPRYEWRTGKIGQHTCDYQTVPIACTSARYAQLHLILSVSIKPPFFFSQANV